ncbi:hypothetical protein G6F37_008387 [Rhizopus arrhizus]|nr:hypothetical protein G6F38_007347 [Rhizopus arrhizus]KAG1155612.1 hypothetical protein G6F37_008387 [Rhizopus arrhizus]
MSKRRATKGDHSKSAENDVAVGTVIFSSGQTKHDEFWDDSELIEHWDKTVELYRTAFKQPAEDHETNQDRETPVINSNFDSSFKTTSSGTEQDDFSNLIMAWYYAGYYTGLYQSK